MHGNSNILVYAEYLVMPCPKDDGFVLGRPLKEIKQKPWHFCHAEFRCVCPLTLPHQSTEGASHMAKLRT